MIRKNKTTPCENMWVTLRLGLPAFVIVCVIMVWVS